jgi:hypothetical protein
MTTRHTFPVFPRASLSRSKMMCHEAIRKGCLVAHWGDDQRKKKQILFLFFEKEWQGDLTGFKKTYYLPELALVF